MGESDQALNKHFRNENHLVHFENYARARPINIMIMDVDGGNPTFNRPLTNEIPFAASMVTRTAACKTTSMIVTDSVYIDDYDSKDFA